MASREYIEMSAAAQRRSAPKVGSPSLVWHLAFWRPPISIEGGTDGAQSTDAWKSEIEVFLRKLFLTLHFNEERRGVRYFHNRAESICYNFDEGVQTLHLFENSYTIDLDRPEPDTASKSSPGDENGEAQLQTHDRFTSIVYAYGVKITVRADRHNEYLSLVIIVDFSEYEYQPNAFGGDGYNERVKDVADILFSLQRIAAERSRGLGSFLQTDNRAKVREGHDKTLGEIKRRLINRTKSIIRTIILDVKRLDEVPGVLTFEGFGLVLGLEPTKHTASAQDRERAILAPIRSQSGEGDVWSKLSPDRGFTDTIAHDVVDAAWPILRYAQFEKSDEHAHGRPEYTVSKVQGGRAIYMSALGRLARRGGAVSIEPVVYVLIPAHGNGWQIGRVVERLHTLGTLRIASMRDILAIRRVNVRLSSLWAAIQRLPPREALSALQANLPPYQYPGTVSREVNRLLNRFGRGRQPPSEEEEVDRLFLSSSLNYRSARSALYIARFREEAERLRIGRIEGFQPYDEYVARRINDAQTFIGRVGRRYQELTQRRQQLEMSAQARGIHDLLAIADKVVFVPIAYYFAMLFEHSEKLWHHPLESLIGVCVSASVMSVLGGILVSLLFVGLIKILVERR